jgi:hypothetical protein
VIRPRLLLDFDGPLNPYRAKQAPTCYRAQDIVENEQSRR